MSQTILPKSILVVDDEPMVRDALRRLLLLQRHQVSVAETGAEALAALAQRQYELVITDFLLPQMDGLTLAQMIKERSPNLPIILISGMLQSLKSRSPGDLAVDWLLEKPFSVQELQNALLKVFPNG